MARIRTPQKKRICTHKYSLENAISSILGIKKSAWTLNRRNSRSQETTCKIQIQGLLATGDHLQSPPPIIETPTITVHFDWANQKKVNISTSQWEFKVETSKLCE